MNPQVVTQAITELRERERQLSRDLEQNRAGQLAIQGLCAHNWRDEGYDPRGGGTQTDKCSYCGLVRRT